MPADRRGTATVELTIVMTFIILPMTLGLWEMGRYVQLQQMVANSAREGARMGAQAVTITSTGSTQQIVTSVTPPNATQLPNVKAAVMQYLSGQGLTNLTYADVDVTFAFQAPQSGDPALVSPVSGATQPHQGVQNQRFRVTVTISDVDGSGNLKPVGQRPLREKILWTTLGFVRPDKLGYQVDWSMMVDLPFNINATVPGW